jgi:hypothetical protein
MPHVFMVSKQMLQQKLSKKVTQIKDFPSIKINKYFYHYHLLQNSNSCDIHFKFGKKHNTRKC